MLTMECLDNRFLVLRDQDVEGEDSSHPAPAPAPAAIDFPPAAERGAEATKKIADAKKRLRSAAVRRTDQGAPRPWRAAAIITPGQLVAFETADDKAYRGDRKCGICSQEGHDRRTCPQRAASTSAAQ